MNTNGAANILLDHDINRKKTYFSVKYDVEKKYEEPLK